MALRLPGAPRWAWIAMAFGIAAFALLLPRVLAVTGPPPGSDAAPAAGSSSAPAEAQSLLVVGDGWTATADRGSSTGWPTALSGDLSATGIEVRTMVSAATGAGYLQRDAEGRTFGDLAASGAEVAPDVVVFFGSESDVASSATVSRAADRTFDTVDAEWPQAQLVVVGPAWAGDSPPAGLQDVRDGVRDAAAEHDASFVDPLAENWFPASARHRLVERSSGYPTQEGQFVIAQRLEPVVREALGEAARGAG